MNKEKIKHVIQKLDKGMYQLQLKIPLLQYIPGYGDTVGMLKKLGACLGIALAVVGTVMQFLAVISRKAEAFNLLKIPVFGLVNIGAVLLIGITVYLAWGIFAFMRMRSPLKDDERKFEYATTNEFGSARPLSGAEYDECIEEVMPGSTDSLILGYGIREPKKVCCVRETKPGERPILSNPHVAVAGGSGAGKSWSFARPAIYQAITGGRSYIVTETSGELFRDTSEIARKHGYEVKLLNYIPDSIFNSDSCNYLTQIINGDSSKALTLATVILENTTENKGFWDDAQKNVLTALILLVDGNNVLPEDRKNLGTILDYVGEGPDKLCSRINALPNTHPAKRYGQLFVHSSKQVQESALFGLGVRLQIFMEPKVRNAVTYDEVSLKAPGEKKCAYYVNISDTESTYQVLSAMFFNFVFVELGNLARKQKETLRLEVPVDVILDEFTNIGILNDFEKTISTVRKYGIRIYPIFQDIGQVINNYPKTYTTILANCALSIYLGGNDVENTAEYYSKLYGTATVVDEAENKPVNVFLPNMPRLFKKMMIRTKARQIYTVDEVLNLEPEYVIVKLERRGPLKLRKFDYRDHPLFKETTKDDLRNIYDHVPEWQKRAKRAPFVEQEVPKAPAKSDDSHVEATEPAEKETPGEMLEEKRQGIEGMKRVTAPAPPTPKPTPKQIPKPIANARQLRNLEKALQDEEDSLMLHDNRVTKKPTNFKDF